MAMRKADVFAPIRLIDICREINRVFLENTPADGL